MNVPKLNNSTPSCALFWDWQNVRCSENEARCLLDFVDIVFNLKSAKAYAYWRNESRRCEEFLYRLRIECQNIPTVAKNAVDKKLIDDCKREILSNSDVDVVILVSGDGDFAQLVRDLKAKGKWVIVIGSRRANQKLRGLANDFHFLDQLCEQAA
jgi:uncharacterized LabA/DUF88 family protein